MGKLSLEESLKSHEAIKCFEEDYGWESFRPVKVFKKGKIKYSLDAVQIIVKHGTYGSDLRELNILWDEGGMKDYKKKGLFYPYSSVYVKVEYINNVLVIHADNNIEIIIG